MVKLKGINAGVLFASFGLLISGEAQAGLPTIDAGNIAGTISVVKNGGLNIESLVGTNGSLGELMTIVGDGSTSLSQFQQDYGAEFSKVSKEVNKAKERKNAQKAQAKEEEEEQRRAEKEAYQQAMDDAERMEAEAHAEMITEYGPEEYIPSSANRYYNDAPSRSPIEEPMTNAPTAEFESRPTPEVRYIEMLPEEGYQEGGENLDGISGLTPEEAAEEEARSLAQAENEVTDSPENQVVVSRGFSLSRPTDAPTQRLDVAEPKATIKPINRKLRVIDTPIRSKALPSGRVIKENATVPSRQPRRKFEMMQPATLEKVSSSIYQNKSVMAFASMDDKGEKDGYIGKYLVAPLAARCSVKAEDFVKNAQVREDCIEKIIRENNANNSQDSAQSMKECREMVFDTIMATLGDASEAKYDSNNIDETLDKQDEIASKSTDTRGDLTVLAMSSKHVQQLTNRMTMLLASELILDTAREVCAAKDDILGDSDLKKDSKKNGGK